MSTQASPPPPPAAETTIGALGDDLLREIFALLPDLPNLARAAFACRAFLRAIRSSPAFRRRFRELRPPPLLAFFLEMFMDPVPVYPSPWRPSDTDLADAFRGADFFETRRMFGLKNDDDPGRAFDYMLDGEIRIAHRKQRASYSPVRQALSLFPDRHILGDGSFLEFHTLSYQEEQGLQRVVCIRHDRYWARARVAVFSSNTMEWQIFPWVETKALVPKDAKNSNPGKVVDGFIYWIFPMGAGMLALDATTSQFHRMDVPPPVSRMLVTTFELGQTKDGKLCIVHLNSAGINDGMLFVWSWGKDSDGVERWVFDKPFPLRTIVEFIKSSMVVHSKVGVLSVIDGFVYLSVDCHEFARNHSDSPEWFLSFCLETTELHLLFEGQYQRHHRAHPYVMPWPPSLVHSKVSPCLCGTILVKFLPTFGLVSRL
uniref:Predicted protein n=1 Tax=Hordeum vulgare subsp. vulgare TaxID=112509 RepID=F2E9V4_HORVV|nr:predicted protein [Hordeum vulgare subsp. vulgare]